jgi:hypothetical protein
MRYKKILVLALWRDELVRAAAWFVCCIGSLVGLRLCYSSETSEVEVAPLTV